MILRLEMPFIDPSISWVRLTRWHKGVGDAVDYGDDVCEVSVEETVTLHTVENANRLATNGARGIERRRYRRSGFEYAVRLVASEMAHLRVVAVGEGARVEPGTTLALLSTDPDEQVEANAAAAFRVVADVADSEVY